MPNWKKLIVSGSNATLNQLNVTTAVTASYFKGDGSALTNLPASAGFPFSGSAIITGSLIVSQSGVQVTGSVNVSGSVTANSFTAQNGVGTPTLTSANSIILSGSEAAIFKGLSLRLNAFTNAQTSSLTSQNGDIIYNSDRDKILLYTGSTWKHILVDGDAANLPDGVISSSAQIDNLFNIDGIVSSSDQITALGFISESASGFPYTGSAEITGALNVIGAVTASYFVGDGSNLTGLSFAQTATVKQTFTSSLSVDVTHGFETRNVLVSVYDFNYDQVIPARIRLTDDNTVNVRFAEITSGHIVVAKGGHIVSGTQEVSELATFQDNFSGVTFYSASHNFNTKNVIVQVYDENDFLVIPNSVELTDDNTAVVKFTTARSGSVVVAKGGHIVSASVDNADNLGNQPGSYYLNYNNFTNTPAGIISSSNAIYNISGSLLPTVTEVFDLGSSSKRWRDLYLSGSTIYLGNSRLTSTTGSNLELLDHNNNRTNLILDELHIGPAGKTSIVLTEHSGSLLIHHSGSSDPLNLTATASLALTASYALNAEGSGFPFTGSAQITGSLGVTGSVTATTFYGDGSNLTGISGGGGTDVVETATIVDNFSAATSHTATHNFNTKNVIVQVFNNSDELIIPSSIITNTVNTVRVTFPEAVTGRVVVAKGGHLITGSAGSGGSSDSAMILKHPKTLTDDITVEDNYNAILISPVSLNCSMSISDSADLHIISF